MINFFDVLELIFETRGSFHNETPKEKDAENTQDGNKGRRKTHKSGIKEGASTIIKINMIQTMFKLKLINN